MADFTRQELIKMREALVLEDKEIGELADSLQVDLQDIMNAIIEDAGSTEGHAPIDIILYVAEQAFRRGYMTGLFHINETTKTTLEEGIRATA